jgi:hypothetical protein
VFAGKMPEAVAREFNAIRSAFGDLHSMWRMYADLFGNKPFAVLIDQWDASSFLVLHRALQTTILISFGRLLDRATTNRGGKVLQNLSFEHLLEVVQGHCPDVSFHAKLVNMLADAKKHCEPLGTWRDKRFGHADRDHTPPFSSEKLPQVDERHIEEGVSKLRAILKEIHTYFNGPNAEFSFPALEGCAEQLMKLVEDGIKFRQAEIAEIFP